MITAKQRISLSLNENTSAEIFFKNKTFGEIKLYKKETTSKLIYCERCKVFITSFV